MPQTAQLFRASKPRNAFRFAAALTFLAGFFDVVGYVELNHLYVSFMSGNSTHLGMALSSFDVSSVLTIVSIIAAFVLGVFAGTCIADHLSERLLFAVSTAETLVLMFACCVSILGHGYLALVWVALAMGMQNSLHQTVSGADVGRGFITGSLFNFGQSLARIRDDKAEALKALANFSVWICFVAGAFTGSLIYDHVGLSVSLLIGLTFFILTVFSAMF
ncbi:YoaK family protein [Brucella pituitosa]|uniref:YoaK family protein n=1 Tax=Brucella pituitosa TaxID=571256 RepID=UPI0011B0F227